VVSLYVDEVGGSAEEIGVAVAEDASDNVYCVGRTSSTSVDGQTGSGNPNTFVVKYSSAGVKLWTVILNAVGTDMVTGVAVDGYNYVLYLTGITMSDPFLGAENPTGTSVFLVALDISDGSQLYASVYQLRTPKAEAWPPTSCRSCSRAPRPAISTM
jgi:hypothetical protein